MLQLAQSSDDFFSALSMSLLKHPMLFPCARLASHPSCRLSLQKNQRSFQLLKPRLPLSFPLLQAWQARASAPRLTAPEHSVQSVRRVLLDCFLRLEFQRPLPLLKVAQLRRHLPSPPLGLELPISIRSPLGSNCCCSKVAKPSSQRNCYVHWRPSLGYRLNC